MAYKDPQRSCIACRTTRNKKDLLRFVLSPGLELVPDLLTKLPGRGAYTCIQSACVRNAMKKKMFNRAFSVEANFSDADFFCSQVKAKINERIGSYLALANKAGKVVSGSDMVMEMMRKGKSGFVFVANDISLEIGAKVKELAKRYEVPHIAIFDKELQGALIGKAPRSVVAIERCGFVETINSEVAKYGNFLEGGVDAR